MTYKKNNDLTIRAHGFGFIFMLMAILTLLIAGVVSLATSFLWFNKDIGLIESFCGLLVIIIFEPFLIIELLNLFKKAKVEFIDHVFITNGQHKKIFPPIHVNCEDFVNYKLISKFGAQCIEFTFKSNKKVLFHIMQFSKKQILTILNEIKIRGGFPNQEVNF